MSGRRLLLPSLLGATLACSLAAQAPTPAAEPASSRTVPVIRDLSERSPFAMDGREVSFRMVPAAEMSAQDQQLLANSEASLRRATALHNIAFDRGDWRHIELDCPSFPKHLLLRFERNNGRGDTSIFSAVIARDGVGTIRVLPILRRSYSLFSPAPRNARTIAIFNRLLREEKTTDKPDWVGLAECYAAFSGQEAEIGAGAPIWSIGPQPTLQLDLDGRASIRLVTAGPPAHGWDLTFARDGRLLAGKEWRENENARTRVVPTGDYPVQRMVPEEQYPVKREVPQVPPGTHNDQ